MLKMALQRGVKDPSILALISSRIAFIFTPLGLNDWRIVTSLFCGVMAKESVVSTLQVLYPAGFTASLTVLSVVCLLVFCLLYTPCIAAIASIKRELGSKYAIGVVAWQCVLAWGIAFIVHVLGSLLI